VWVGVGWGRRKEKNILNFVLGLLWKMQIGLKGNLLYTEWSLLQLCVPLMPSEIAGLRVLFQVFRGLFWYQCVTTSHMITRFVLSREVVIWRLSVLFLPTPHTSLRSNRILANWNMSTARILIIFSFFRVCFPCAAAGLKRDLQLVIPVRVLVSSFNKCFSFSGK
jgi:hypothetical protein